MRVVLVNAFPAFAALPGENALAVLFTGFPEAYIVVAIRPVKGSLTLGLALHHCAGVQLARYKGQLALAVRYAVYHGALIHIAVGKFENAWAVGALGLPLAVKCLATFPSVDTASIGYAGVDLSTVVISGSILHATHALRNAGYHVAIKTVAVGKL